MRLAGLIQLGRRAGASVEAMARDAGANAAVTFGIVLPVVVAAVGVAVDYSFAAAARSKMQPIADAAAIAAAREMQMAQANATRLIAIVDSYVQSQLKDTSSKTAVDFTKYTVQVDLSRDYQMTFGKMVSPLPVTLRASATARLSGGLPLCLVALDLKAKGTITLQKNARLTAPACQVYSDSKSPQGMVSKDSAVMRAGSICSAGGRVKSADTNYSPQPLTDCPIIPDPLASRQGPTDFTCNYKDKVLDRAVATLSPGVYCGGLVVTNGAQVTLSPGIFVFKDGPLLVDGNASLKGTNVAIYMKGANANFTFATASSISLTAPKSGPLAGILIFDDPSGMAAPERSAKHDKPGKSAREHSILSDDARVLLGTIYMPKGRLIIDATRPISDRSAYTVLVLQQLDLYEGPNLFLNTDYAGSDIPVPKGLGPYGAKVILAN
ncbi:MAG: pilus assembly protein [Hyphomicrobiales bacterium]|nr:pilus assembly protein [Hyphomicrobiales bacterium]